MTIELRVLSGSRAGSREQFEKSVIAVGRHPLSDLRFDPHADLDVSTRHAELRCVDGVWSVYDQSSTNGTFVNGSRVAGTRQLMDGDIVSFGANGPKVEVHFGAAAPKDAPPRVDTTIRIAEAVKAQTASIRRSYLVAGGALLVLVAVVGVWTQQRSGTRDREFRNLLARSESTSMQMERLIRELAPRDSLAARQLAARTAARKQALEHGRRAALAGGRAGDSSLALFRQRLDQDVQVQQSLAQLNGVTVRERNDPAVAMIASDLDGTFIAATAFCITPGGLMVTNRHVIRTEAGNPARRISVIFANTNTWLPARIVRIDDDDDLALIQVDVPGSYPVVAGVSSVGALARVGSPVLSIGYPHAVDTPMEGSGLKITARTSIAMGTVSKRLADVLQMDSYAGHGSSGSPVFDAGSSVVGVIYGGAPESNGRIVYAVPAERLAAFIRGDAPGILR